MFPMGQIGWCRELGSGLTDLEVCKRVARYAKGSVLNVMVELIEPMSEAALLVSTRAMGISNAHSRRLDIRRNLLIRVEQNLGEGFVAEHLLEDHTSIQCDLFAFVAFEGSEDDVGLAAEVLYGRPSGAYLPAKEVIEYLGDVLTRFKLETSDVSHKMLEEISGVGFLSELRNQFRLGIYSTDISPEGELYRAGKPAVRESRAVTGPEQGPEQKLYMRTLCRETQQQP